MLVLFNHLFCDAGMETNFIDIKREIFDGQDGSDSDEPDPLLVKECLKVEFEETDTFESEAHVSLVNFN